MLSPAPAVLGHASTNALPPLLGAGERLGAASHQISNPTFRLRLQGLLLRALKKILLATALVLLGTVACGGGNPITAVLNKKAADVALQQSEAKGLTKCSSSGTIDQTLATLKTSDPASYTTTKQEWTKLQAAGADNAYFAIYASDTTTCSSFSANSSTTPKANAKVIGSLVVEFKNATDAQKGYTGGAFGIDPKSATSGGQGAKSGTATGLGANSVSAFFSAAGYSIYFALWQHDKWLAYMFTEGYAEADSAALSKLVDSRF
jgi:hypothetical protein